jgi:hypothetical protein
VFRVFCCLNFATLIFLSILSFSYINRMKPIIILIANILLLFYFVMFFVDNSFFPKETIFKIRNLLFVLMACYLSYNVLYIYILKKEKPENGIVYKIASGSKVVLTKAYLYIQPFQKELLTWTLIAVGLAFVGMIAMGIPGYLFLQIPVKLGMCKAISGDNSWPAAILVSMFWPFLLPAGLIFKNYLIRAGYASYGNYGWIGTVVAGIILLVSLTYLMYGKTKS